jgi:predicted O-methyltransferase YrrM
MTLSGSRARIAHHVGRVKKLAIRTLPHPEFDKLTNGPQILSAIRSSIKSSVGQEIEKRRTLLLKNKRLLCEIGANDLHLPTFALGLYDEGVTVSDCADISRPARDGDFLYSLCLQLRPQTCLELGTNIGISSAYLAAGMRAAGGGKLITLEASPVRAYLARKLHADLGLPTLDCRLGLFDDTLAPSLESLRSTNLVFIDGHHQYEPTLRYWNLIAPFCSPGSVVVFDDTRWSAGMIQAWDELKRDERFSSVVDLGWLGLCVVGKGPATYADARALY